MEHELSIRVPAGRSDATDACGCTPPAASGDVLPGAETPPSELTSTPKVADATEAPRRTLKLVMTLALSDHGQYRASLALGSDDCDPILRTATVMGLPDALEQVPALLDEAEARWRLQPRNRATSTVSPRRSTADRRPPATPPPRSSVPLDQERPSEQAAPDVAPSAATEAVETPKRPGAGQLTLFG
ncbi:MAG: hypothetical protein IT305_12830 [Chloroflexi bacterium]|nr:hypothetical protein [Chloroflexota bacterium]